MSLRLEINLRKFSAIAVATALWNNEKIKSKVHQYYVEINPLEFVHKFGWNNILQEVLDQVDLLCLPRDLIIFLKHYIEAIGENILYWKMHVVSKLGLPHEYGYNIYWTSFGIIDVNKIFENYWTPIAQKILQKPDKILEDYNICLMACLFVQKKFIRQYFNEMIKGIQLLLPSLKISGGKLSVNAVIIIWLCIVYSPSKEGVLELYKKVKNSGMTDKCMFILSVKSGFLGATKYFWSRFHQDVKDDVMLELADNCLLKVKETLGYKGEITQLLIFLINNMSSENRKNFISKNIVTLFELFISASGWPFQEVIEPIIDEFLHDLSEDQIKILLGDASQCILDDLAHVNFFGRNASLQIMPKIFSVATKDLKILFVNFKNFFVVESYFYKFNTVLLSMILNDPDLLDYKEKILNMGKLKYRDLIKSRYFGLLNKFIKSVFHSKTEEREFKLKINVLPDLIIDRNYKLADELLKWLSVSNKELTSIKNKIDPIEICFQFKNLKCSFLDELLCWLYDTEEEKMKAKESMKKMEFIKDATVKIWNENGKEGEKECLDFLKWLLDTEEEVLEFKKKLLIDENIVKKFSDTLPSSDSFERIDELLNFLLVTPEKVLEIKQKIIKNVNDWIKDYIVDRKNFKLADAMVSWVFTDEKQKSIAMRKFINSINGVVLLVKAFMICRIGHYEPLLSLFNCWVKQFGDFNIIVKYMAVYSMNVTDNLEKSVVDRLATLFEILIKKGKIPEYIINNLLLKDDDIHL